MTKKSQKFELTEQKLPLKTDLKIRRKLFFTFLGKLFVPSKSHGFFAPTLRVAFSALMLAIFVYGGNIGLTNYAYNSNSLPGDLLYKQKKAEESKKLAQLKTPEKRSEFYLILSDRRLDEASQSLQKQGFNIIAVAYANQVVAPSKEDLSENKLKLDNNIATRLLFESSQYVSLSVKEAGKVKDKNEGQKLLFTIDKKIEEQEKRFEDIVTNANDQNVGKAAIAAQNIHKNNEKKVETAFGIIRKTPATDENHVEETLEEIFQAADFDLEPDWIELEFMDDLEAEILEEMEELIQEIDELEDWAEYELEELEHEFENLEEELEEIIPWFEDEDLFEDYDDDEFDEIYENYLLEYDDDFEEDFDDWDDEDLEELAEEIDHLNEKIEEAELENELDEEEIEELYDDLEESMDEYEELFDDIEEWDEELEFEFDDDFYPLPEPEYIELDYEEGFFEEFDDEDVEEPGDEFDDIEELEDFDPEEEYAEEDWEEEELDFEENFEEDFDEDIFLDEDE